MPSLDLIVFPEYCLHGLSMSTARADVRHRPEVGAFRDVCREQGSMGLLLMEENGRQPNGTSG